MTYDCGIDFDAVVAIDFHTHVEVDRHGRYSDPMLLDDVAADFPGLPS